MAAPDLATARWRTSSFSANNGVCIEVADLGGGHHAVRDSKNPTGPALTLPAAAWTTFTTGVRTGQFG